VAVAATMHALAALRAMTGDFDHARRLLSAANETRHKLGDIGSSVSHHQAFVEMLAGHPQRAEAQLRRDLGKLERMGDRGMLSTTKAMLAQAVYAQGRSLEAERLCRETELTAAADDIVTQIVWRCVAARILADAGDCEAAERLAGDAVALAESTDFLTDHADALLDLAHVLRAGPRGHEADLAARAAMDLYRRKGNVVGVARAAEMLAA